MTRTINKVFELPIRTGSEVHGQMVRYARSLFGLAALALVAIAATIGAMYALHEGTASWVSESREISRLARVAYVLTVERELALIEGGVAPADAVSNAAGSNTEKLTIIIDSLVSRGAYSSDRAYRVAAIEDASKRWLKEDIKAQNESRSSRERKRFNVLRSRLALFILAEDARYAEKLARERQIRMYTAIALLLELMILLVVINSIRNKLVAQATELLRQKESIEKQAAELEQSNRELAGVIEERESANKVIAEEAEEQAALFNAITEVFYVLDRDGFYHKVAPSADERESRSRQKLLGRRVQDVLPGPTAALALSSISQALDTRGKIEVEYSLEWKGETTWYAGTVNPLTEDKVLWVVRDISDTKKAAEAIKESEARFRNLVEHSPQAVALHAEGRLLYANPTCANLLGYPLPEQLIGEPILRFVTRETSSRFIESLVSMSRSAARAPTVECQFRPANDGRIL
ncbi:MAG TPA: PAS domain-containing protein, partial [Gemmatimonadaceae bacterium]